MQLAGHEPRSAAKNIANILATVSEIFLKITCLRPSIHAQSYYFLTYYLAVP